MVALRPRCAPCRRSHRRRRVNSVGLKNKKKNVGQTLDRGCNGSRSSYVAALDDTRNVRRAGACLANVEADRSSRDPVFTLTTTCATASRIRSALFLSPPSRLRPRRRPAVAIDTDVHLPRQLLLAAAAARRPVQPRAGASIRCWCHGPASAEAASRRALALPSGSGVGAGGGGGFAARGPPLPRAIRFRDIDANPTRFIIPRFSSQVDTSALRQRCRGPAFEETAACFLSFFGR